MPETRKKDDQSKAPKALRDNFKSGERIRANIRTTVNASSIREETLDGRQVIIVPSATLPDDVVMNGIKYPADEIEKSFGTLEGTPAPLGHPNIEGMFVPARSPLGLNLGYFGAWNGNVRREKGRVFLDKIIDKERANESAMGKRVLEALNSKKPIHTSTGLFMSLRECNDDSADYEAYDMDFDHDAILLDEDGAATPDQGVGMLVNSAQCDGKTVDVVNSDLGEMDYFDSLGVEMIAALERRDAVSQWERMRDAIMEVFRSSRDMVNRPQREEAMNMAGEEEKKEGEGLEKLANRLSALEERMNAMDETIANMSNQQATNTQQLAAINAEKDAATNALVAKVVEAELLTEEEAKATPTKALQALLNSRKEKPKPAPGIFAGFNGGAETEKVSLGEDWEV